jgi:hypothetical protein
MWVEIVILGFLRVSVGLRRKTFPADNGPITSRCVVTPYRAEIPISPTVALWPVASSTGGPAGMGWGLG